MHLLKDLLRSPTVAAVLLVAGLAVVFNSGPSSGTVYKWSTTASTNATADASINWAEGMAPSAVNDSARAMMAAVAKWRNDLAGFQATGGTATAYTLSTSQGFASLSAMSGQNVCFRTHTTSGATVTLNVDSLGAKSLRSQAGSAGELAAGALQQDTPYCAVYNNSNSEWLLVGMSSQAWSVPIGGMIDYAGSSVPNNNFVIPRGQCLLRANYVALFALIGTTYPNGSCSGSEFAVPDLGGRVVAGTESLASRLTSGVSGCTGSTLGSTCGAQSVTLATGNLPSHSHPIGGNTGSGLNHSHNLIGYLTTTGGSNTGPVMTTAGQNTQQVSTESENNHIHSLPSNTGNTGAAEPINKQPATIVLTKLLRVL